MRSVWTSLVMGAMLVPSIGKSQNLVAPEDLSRGALAMLNYVPKDEFDAPPDSPSVAGKRFSYTITPSGFGNENFCPGYPGASYDLQQSEFFVTLNMGDLTSDYFKMNNQPVLALPRKSWHTPAFKVLGFDCRNNKGQSYTASNAYGAKVTVEKMDITVVGIAFTGFRGENEKIWDKPDNWVKSMPADEARALSSNIKIRVTGTLGVWPNGRTLLCGAVAGFGPTIDSPSDVKTIECLYAGEPERFEVIDSATNVVLYSAEKRPTKK
jgi:hypothetical protein